jgi:hypothetical protein
MVSYLPLVILELHKRPIPLKIPKPFIRKLTSMEFTDNVMWLRLWLDELSLRQLLRCPGGTQFELHIENDYDVRLLCFSIFSLFVASIFFSGCVQ